MSVAVFVSASMAMRFDGGMIRKDGIFLPKDLKPLKPPNLK
jgi:hypothetical protein